MSSIFTGAGIGRNLRADLLNAIQCAVDLFQTRQFERKEYTDDDLKQQGVLVALQMREKLEPLGDREAACYLFGACRLEYFRMSGVYSRGKQRRRPNLHFAGESFWAVQGGKEPEPPSSRDYRRLVVYARRAAFTRGRGRRSALKDRIVAATFANDPIEIIMEREGVSRRYIKDSLAYTAKRIRERAILDGIIKETS